MEPTTAVSQITTAITTNMTDATGIVIAAGMALIAISFVQFVLRKGKRAASGKV